jgi:hypothetical protein
MSPLLWATSSFQKIIISLQKYLQMAKHHPIGSPWLDWEQERELQDEGLKFNWVLQMFEKFAWFIIRIYGFNHERYNLTKSNFYTKNYCNLTKNYTSVNALLSLIYTINFR